MQTRTAFCLFLISSALACAAPQPGEPPDGQAPPVEHGQAAQGAATAEAQGTQGADILRPCCSTCPPDDLDDHCWDICALSC